MPSRPTVLAIDPGASTGWAVSSPAGPRFDDFGTWRLSLKQGGGARLLDFERRLNELARIYPALSLISYEKPFIGKNLNAPGPLFHFEGYIWGFAARRGLPCVGYQPTEIKAHVGDGRANKEQIIEAVKRRGYTARTSHEADAIALMLLAISEGDQFDLFGWVA